MIGHMTPRQFKKLCCKSHALVLRIHPTYASCSFTPDASDFTDGWFHTVLKGTKGFGGTSGGMEPEWSDQSAWSLLCEIVYWHFTFLPDLENDITPVWPRGLEPRRWQDYLALAHRMARERSAEATAPPIAVTSA